MLGLPPDSYIFQAAFIIVASFGFACICWLGYKGDKNE